MNLRIHDDDLASTEVIRPAAVLSELDARRVLKVLQADDVHKGGRWWVRTGSWRLYDQPLATGDEEPANAVHVGTISCVYDTPNRYWVTIFRVSLTAFGLRHGWSTARICDEALQHADLTLDSCPRAQLSPPPRPMG